MVSKKSKRIVESMASSNMDLEELLEKKEKLDQLLEKKFKKVITVMFTDLKGSTAIAEREGDVAVRMLLKRHNDILFPIIKDNSGVLVKTMGDGTMSYFENTGDAVRSAVNIQKGIEEYNGREETVIPIHMRIGMHTGKGIVEKHDIFGDVVNVASRFESLAEVGEIYLSEHTYETLEDKEKIFCRFIKTSELKGKKDAFKIYKAYWKEDEIEQAKSDEVLTDEASTSSIFISRGKIDYGKSSKEVAEESAALGPSLVIENADKTRRMVSLADQELLMGRSTECGIKFDDNFISRKHARIFADRGEYYIEDLNSNIGTALNGKTIYGEELLKNGDEISLGNIRITFVNPKGAAASGGKLSQEEAATMAMTTARFYKLVVLSVEGDITEYPFQEEVTVIGRLSTCTVHLDDNAVSRYHARIWASGDDICLEDCGSNNGTFVDGGIIEKNKTITLKEDQEFIISSYRMMAIDAAKKADKSLFNLKGGSIVDKVKDFLRKK
ncbi:MAG: adenylate/guanylate cyclase domain-containing protein [Nitrospinota bacterium]